ncbi:MAG: DedA family protein [Firmicutes bacterium]|nr:DedA family protein [Bacillota bacterium]
MDFLLTRAGIASLFALSVVEAVIFPVPPDTLLIPMSAARPALALVYAAVTTVGSVIGAVLGYTLGLKGGRPILARLASRDRIAAARALFARYDMWAVGVAGFTPIPFKLVTVISGVLRLPLRRFVFASFVSRGARFFLEAWLIALFGPQVVDFIGEYFGWITFGITLLGIAVHTIYKRARRNSRPRQET